MRKTVVTSFSPEGWELYGENFVDSFNEFWPMSVKLICAWEGQSPRRDLNGFDLLETEPAHLFFARHKDNPVICGKKPHPKWPWKKPEPYNFRYDAYKFAHKVFALTAASRYVADGKLYWLDADVVTNKEVTIDFLNLILPDLADISYLPRPDYSHSECGFIGFNLDHRAARLFLKQFEDIYASDEFLNLSAWHDSYVFDTLVEWTKPHVFHIVNNSRAQPFDNSILGTVMTHLKGRRKHGAPGWTDKPVSREAKAL